MTQCKELSFDWRKSGKGLKEHLRCRHTKRCHTSHVYRPNDFPTGNSHIGWRGLISIPEHLIGVLQY